MKALTISQPFASLIASGAKWVENRTWPTTHRGPLAIHAGRRSQYLGRADLARYPTGVVIATCELVGCVELAAVADICPTVCHCSGRTLGEIMAHEHTEGPWCWILADVRPVLPVETRGRLGLWDYEGPTQGVHPQAAFLGPVGPGTIQESSPSGGDGSREPSGPGRLF